MPEFFDLLEPTPVPVSLAQHGLVSTGSRPLRRKVPVWERTPRSFEFSFRRSSVVVFHVPADEIKHLRESKLFFY